MVNSAGTERTPVLVLGSGVTALGVCRVLRAAGIHCYLVASEDDFARSSRFVHPVSEPSVESDDPSRLASYLASLRFSRAVLMPCSDTWLRAVAGLDPATRQRFPASVPASSVVDVFTDKGRFSETLRGLRVPMPMTRFMREPRDLDSLSDAELTSYFLKPRDSQRFSERFRKKAFRISDRSDAVQLLELARQAGLEVVAQEYIPGPPNNHHFVDGFVDRAGHVRALFARQRLLMYPIDFGNSTLLVSESRDVVQPAIAHLTRLLSELSYRGIFSAEFKLDERDGEFKLLEVNARPWWYIEFAARAGVDIPVLAYRDALDLEMESIEDYTLDMRHMIAPQHVRALFELRREGRLTIRSWFSATRGASDAVFRWTDPIPGIAMAAGYVRQSLSH